MWRRFRPPLAVVALALLGLIVLLAVLQYHWLGQISDAERIERRATLAAGAREFSQDFDREITRGYLLFQADAPLEGPVDDAEMTGRFAARYDRWQATASFPRLIKEFYVYAPDRRPARCCGGSIHRRGCSNAAEWPDSMREWSTELASATWNNSSSSNTRLLHSPHAVCRVGDSAGDRRADADDRVGPGRSRLAPARPLVHAVC